MERTLTEELGLRRERGAVVLSDLHGGETVNPEREDRFGDDILAILGAVSVRPSCFGREHFPHLAKLLFEAIQNVYDHAGRKPFPEGGRLESSFQFKYHRSLADRPELAGYLDRIAAAERRRTDFVQACVTDDGVGIAARHSQDLRIYQGPIGAEESAVKAALTGRSSVKLLAQDCRIRGTPGQGFTYISASLKALKAFAVLRTGRLLATFDGSYDATKGFALTETGLRCVQGTALDVLIPIPKDTDV
jgi:hypothetical protein